MLGEVKVSQPLKSKAVDRREYDLAFSLSPFAFHPLSPLLLSIYVVQDLQVATETSLNSQVEHQAENRESCCHFKLFKSEAAPSFHLSLSFSLLPTLLIFFPFFFYDLIRH